MNALIRRLSTLGLAVTLIVSFSLVLTSCGTELGGVLYIVGNTVPEKSTCLVQAQGSGGQQAFRSKGVLDLSVRESYVAYFLVVNQSPQFESISGFETEDGRLDQSMIILDTATVTMSMSSNVVAEYNQVMAEASISLGLSDSIWGGGQTCDAQKCTTTYDMAISAELISGGTSAVIFNLVPPNYGRILRHLPIFVQAGLDEGPAAINLGVADIELLFDITLSGRRHDGKRVSSEPFNYSVEVCNNCLVLDEFPAAVALNPFQPADGSEPVTVDEIIGDLCAPGSDEVVTNAWCSVAYGVGTCQQIRCLNGIGEATPTGSELTLYCPNDGVSYSPNNL